MLKYIEAFLMIVEKGGFFNAAETLYISQPTITARIQRLEDELKVKLFERVGGKKAVLTRAGEDLYPFYKQAYQFILEGNQTISTSPSQPAKIIFSCPNIIGDKIFPELLKVFQSEHPNIDFSLKINPTPKIIEDVRNGKIDIGLVYLNNEKPNIEDCDLVEVSQEKHVLVCAPNHPLAQNPDLKITDMRYSQMIVYNKTYKTKANQYLKNKGVEKYKILEIKNMEWLKTTLKKGLGIAFIYRSIVKEELERKELIELLPIDDIPHTSLSLLIRNSLPKHTRCTLVNTIRALFDSK